jgi:hypothetical protein
LISLEWASRRNERIDFSLERIRKIAETLKAEFKREQILSKLTDSQLGASLAATKDTQGRERIGVSAETTVSRNEFPITRLWNQAASQSATR